MELPTAIMAIIAQGYLAVDLFFILSGFVIYLNYQAKIVANFPHGVIAFYWNRFSRIYPLHFAVMIAYGLFAIAFFYFSKSGRPPSSYNATTFIESMLLIQAWGFSEMSWNVPSWSISAEWFVYLLFPLMALTLSRFLHGLLRHFIAATSLIFAISIVYFFAEKESLGSSVMSMALPRAVLEFLLGSVVASMYMQHSGYLTRLKYLFLIAFISVSAIYVSFSINDYILIPLSFLLLITYLCVDQTLLSKVLSFPPLVYLGEISYVTYIFHYLIFDILKASLIGSSSSEQIYVYISFLILLVISILAHHLVEVPSQKYLRTRFKLSAI